MRAVRDQSESPQKAYSVQIDPVKMKEVVNKELQVRAVEAVRAKAIEIASDVFGEQGPERDVKPIKRFAKED